MMDEAIRLTTTAEIFVVIGSSLNVYPAAGLIDYAPSGASLWLIDPNDVNIPISRRVEVIKEKASEGVALLRGKVISFIRSPRDVGRRGEGAEGENGGMGERVATQSDPLLGGLGVGTNNWIFVVGKNLIKLIN